MTTAVRKQNNDNQILQKDNKDKISVDSLYSLDSLGKHQTHKPA